MSLLAPGGNVAARDGITFGGASITANGWSGHWSSLSECKDNSVIVEVPSASALVVKLAIM
jgi:hypothetical protein